MDLIIFQMNTYFALSIGGRDHHIITNAEGGSRNLTPTIRKLFEITNFTYTQNFSLSSIGAVE